MPRFVVAVRHERPMPTTDLRSALEGIAGVTVIGASNPRRATVEMTDGTSCEVRKVLGPDVIVEREMILRTSVT